MATATDWHRDFVALVNRLRTEHHLPPLAIDAHLQDAAAWRARDMVERNYFAHDTPPVGPREAARPVGAPHEVLSRFGYDPDADEWTAGENIIVGDPSDGGTVSAADVFAAWRDSPPHIENLVGASYRAIGIGGPVGTPGEHPMSGVCVIELGSELMAPVGEPERVRLHLPTCAPPREVRQERVRPRPERKRREPRAASRAEAVVAVLAGRIKTPAPWGGGFGCDWSQINQWDAILLAATQEFNVPFHRLKGHVVIESQGNPKAFQLNPTNGDSYGLLQVVPYGIGWEGWHREVIRLAGREGDPAEMLVRDPALNVRVGTFILRNQYETYRDWDRASSAFFLGNPNWVGWDTVNGNSGPAYRTSLRGLIEELRRAESGGDEGDGADGADGHNGHRPGTGAALVAEARRHLGRPYVWATAGPDSFDCSGYVYYCVGQVTGEPLPPEFRDSHRQYQWGDPVAPANARPGDLVFYDTADGAEWRLGNKASHVGIYAGGNDLLNALNEFEGVVVSDLSTAYWANRWIGTRRILPPD